MLNREPSRSICAHSRDECGPCLPGYIDDLLTNNRRSDFCQPFPDSYPYTTEKPIIITESMTLPYAIVILISALAFVVVAISIALGIYGLRKWKRVTVASSPTEILDRQSSDEAESCLHPVPLRDPPPPYEIDAQDPDTTTTSTAIVTHRLEIRSIDERKVSAVPFQSPDYEGRRGRHHRSLVSVTDTGSDEEELFSFQGALEFEGELELGLGSFNHPSPSRSDATETSDWRPGELSSLPELPAMEEEEEADRVVTRSLIESESGEEGGEEVNRPSGSPVSSRAAAATDSAFANDDESSRISALVDDDLDDAEIGPPEPFLLEHDRDSALGSQRSVNSARLQSSTLSSMSSGGLRRSYSNIEMITRPSLKRQKSNNNSVAMAKKTKEDGADFMTTSEEE